MLKKTVTLTFLLGLILLSGCHAAQRTTVRAGYYDSYPYGARYVDPYFYPAYYYDPYPRFFFGSEFLFFHPRHNFVFVEPRFRGPGRSLRGRGRAVAPSPGPAPSTSPNTGGGSRGGGRSLRGR